jgi:type II secretory pathway pseudopilin PulG
MSRQKLRTLPRRPAFSMIETVLSIILVGGLFIASLSTAGAAAAARRTQTNRNEGLLLAQDMMAEVLQQGYEEPNTVTVLGINVTSLLGLDAGELLGGSSRANYDDVDDYNGWSGAPQTKQGTSIAWAGAYAISVEVVPVELDKPRKSTTLETGVKRVTVVVKRGSKEVARLVAYRSKNWGGRVDN